MMLLTLIRYRRRLLAELDLGWEQVDCDYGGSARPSRTLRLIHARARRLWVNHKQSRRDDLRPAWFLLDRFHGKVAQPRRIARAGLGEGDYMLGDNKPRKVIVAIDSQHLHCVLERLDRRPVQPIEPT
jgi:hypothetical protein